MRLIESEQEFLTKINQHKKGIPVEDIHNRMWSLEDVQFFGSMGDKKLVIQKQNFESLSIEGIRFSRISFENCTFSDCEFSDVDFALIAFNDCEFVSCDFHDVLFLGSDFENDCFNKCNIHNAEVCDTVLSNTTFNETSLSNVTINSDAPLRNVVFDSVDLAECHFRMFANDIYESNYSFIKCILTECSFHQCNLLEVQFNRTTFVRSSFVHCFLGIKTITTSCNTEDNNYSSLDLHTINNSEIIHPTVLEKIFGITEPDIKGFANGLTRKVELQSAFISYSFKDKEFASMLNHALMMKGVVTFLWEKDAPGGQPLRKIMSENVHKHERLIFIASENSIKSEACQYELTQGRERQDKDWTTILFPIHIDGYLFKVTEDDIRPREKRPEYWKNIQELRDINSTDFSAFHKPRPNKDAFDKATSKLVKDLRKDRNKE